MPEAAIEQSRRLYMWTTASGLRKAGTSTSGGQSRENSESGFQTSIRELVSFANAQSLSAGVHDEKKRALVQRMHQE
ncbi:hypothetical protein HN011_012310 [Eciton burchellii]|nr:hypothetical protein HN011_012310 [Eciton burchellii]